MNDTSWGPVVQRPGNFKEITQRPGQQGGQFRGVRPDTAEEKITRLI